MKNQISIKKSNLWKIATIVLSVLLAISLYYNFNDNDQDPTNKDIKSMTFKDLTDDDAVLGDKNAKVTIVEFSDYQCPFCRRHFTQVFSSIKKEFIDAGKVKLVFRDFPLINIHPGAVPAAIASECAEEQDKFWEMHDKIFGEQNKQGEATVKFGNADLKKWASEIGLDSEDFDKCLESDKYLKEVQNDLVEGNNIGIRGTPGFVILIQDLKKEEINKKLGNLEPELARFIQVIEIKDAVGLVFSAALPFENFKDILEALI